MENTGRAGAGTLSSASLGTSEGRLGTALSLCLSWSGQVPSLQFKGILSTVRRGGAGGGKGSLFARPTVVLPPLDGHSSVLLGQWPVGPIFSVRRSDRWEQGAEFWGKFAPPKPAPDFQVVPVMSWRKRWSSRTMGEKPEAWGQQCPASFLLTHEKL